MRLYHYNQEGYYYKSSVTSNDQQPMTLLVEPIIPAGKYAKLNEAKDGWIYEDKSIRDEVKLAEANEAKRDQAETAVRSAIVKNGFSQEIQMLIFTAGADLTGKPKLQEATTAFESSWANYHAYKADMSKDLVLPTTKCPYGYLDLQTEAKA